MRVLELTLNGFGSYAHETSLDLRRVGVCAVTGHNGAGKSTLFDAILWALYGAVPGKATSELVNELGGPAYVRVVLDVAGKEYTFQRERPMGNKPGLAFFSSPTDGEITGARPVTAEAERLLNCPRDILALTALSRQGDSGRFGSMDAGRRRSALTSVLLAGIFDEPLKIAEEANTRLATVAIKAARDVENIEVKADELTEAEQKLEVVKREAETSYEIYKGLAEENKQAEGVAARLASAEAAHRRMAQNKRAMQEAMSEASAAEKEQRGAESQLEKAELKATSTEKNVIHKRKIADSASRESAASSKEAEESPERIKMLERGEGECWTCGSDLGSHALQELIDQEEALIEAARQARQSHQKASKELSTAEREASVASNKFNQLKVQRDRAEQTYKQSLKRAKLAKTSMEEAKEDAIDLEELRKQVETFPDATEVAKAEHHSNTTQRELGRVLKWVEEAKEATEKLADLKVVSEQAADESRGAELLKQSLGPSGLPHLALETAISKLSIASNEALEQLGNIQIRFVLDDAAKANPPLDIEARDGWSSEWRKYGTFSGGEKMKMDIALRIGLTRVIGVKCRTMVLDEGWRTLDAPAAASLAKLLMTLIRTGSIDAFYTISHVGAAVEQFNHRIEVEKDQMGSRATLVTA